MEALPFGQFLMHRFITEINSLFFLIRERLQISACFTNVCVYVTFPMKDGQNK